MPLLVILARLGRTLLTLWVAGLWTRISFALIGPRHGGWIFGFVFRIFDSFVTHGRHREWCPNDNATSPF
jgi:hypothetical protein